MSIRLSVLIINGLANSVVNESLMYRSRDLKP